MSPHAPCTDTALRVLPLLERGRDALKVYLASHFKKVERPIGGAHIDVVTHEDFVANAELCLQHVVRNGSPMHILCADGALCALIERRTGNW